jgi:hypothetical protein
VLVTSRDRLAGMVARDGARPLSLDVLDHAEAITLLARVLGAQRVEAEPRQSAELVEQCARLPLALRIAAANLAFDPRRRIADQVADLGAGLGALEIEGDPESAVRAAFDLSYEALDEPARLLFRRLGPVPGPDVTAPAAAALVEGGAGKILDRLTSAHLVNRDGDRYALHDLMRLYARERAEREDPGADAALNRLGDWYLGRADAAARVLYPTAVRLPVQESGAPRFPTWWPRCTMTRPTGHGNGPGCWPTRCAGTSCCACCRSSGPTWRKPPCRRRRTPRRPGRRWPPS